MKIELDVLEWATDAEVGECLIYHTAPSGACTGAGPSGPSALRASDQGLVFLGCRRRMGMDEYLAIRISSATAMILHVLPEDKARALGVSR